MGGTIIPPEGVERAIIDVLRGHLVWMWDYYTIRRDSWALPDCLTVLWTPKIQMLWIRKKRTFARLRCISRKNCNGGRGPKRRSRIRCSVSCRLWFLFGIACRSDFRLEWMHPLWILFQDWAILSMRRKCQRRGRWECSRFLRLCWTRGHFLLGREIIEWWLRWRVRWWKGCTAARRVLFLWGEGMLVLLCLSNKLVYIFLVWSRTTLLSPTLHYCS